MLTAACPPLSAVLDEEPPLPPPPPTDCAKMPAASRPDVWREPEEVTLTVPPSPPSPAPPPRLNEAA